MSVTPRKDLSPSLLGADRHLFPDLLQQQLQDFG